MAKTNPPEKLGSLIRTSRTERGLSQEVLGKRVGLPQTYISKLEHGKWLAGDLTLLSELSTELDIPFKMLVDLTVEEMAKQ